MNMYKILSVSSKILAGGGLVVGFLLDHFEREKMKQEIIEELKSENEGKE